MAHIWNYEKNKIPFFFINTDLILYHSCSVLVLICFDMVFKKHATELASNFLTIYRALIIVMYVFIGAGLLMYKRIKLFIDPDEYPEHYEKLKKSK